MQEGHQDSGEEKLCGSGGTGAEAGGRLVRNPAEENQKYGSEARKFKLTPLRPGDRGPAVSKLQQVQAKGKEIAVEEEVCSSRASGRNSENKYKHLWSYPRKPELEILKEWEAADSELRALDELRSIKKTLSDLRCEVERGLGRIVRVIQVLEGGGPGLGDKLLGLGRKEPGKAGEEGLGPGGLMGANGPKKRIKKKKKNVKKKKAKRAWPSQARSRNDEVGLREDQRSGPVGVSSSAVRRVTWVRRGRCCRRFLAGMSGAVSQLRPIGSLHRIRCCQRRIFGPIPASRARLKGEALNRGRRLCFLRRRGVPVRPEQLWGARSRSPVRCPGTGEGQRRPAMPWVCSFRQSEQQQAWSFVVPAIIPGTVNSPC
jgi:hypothetical protein